MGILDDAIREHLDLKRRHGAREAELREIEDEALGSGDQPDPFSAGGELFGEASSGGPPGAQGTTATEEPPAGLGESAPGGEEPTRLVEPEALRGEPTSPPSEPDLLSGEPESGIDQLESREPETSEPEIAIPDQPVEPPEAGESEGPSESLEELIAEEEPFPEDAAAPPAEDSALSEPTPLPEEPDGPPPVSPDQESLDVPALEPDEAQEPPLEPSDSVPDPPPPPPDTGPEPPGRARGRVDVPTQEHPPPGDTGGLPPLPADEPGFEAEPAPPEEPFTDEGSFGDDEPAGSGGPALYDFETDEESVTPSSEPPPDTGDDFEALGPAEEEAPYLEEEEPYAEEPGFATEAPRDEPPLDEPSTEVRPSLEDEEASAAPPAGEPYEEGEDDDEDLWFEKGPPKDFDFDD